MAKKLINTGVGQSIQLFAKHAIDKVKSGFQRLVGGIFQSTVDEERAAFNQRVKEGKFNAEEMFSSGETELPTAREAKAWFLKYAQRHKYKGVLLQGQLYSFAYTNPLHKATLDHFDTFPLILSFGVYFANTGNIVEQGVNLHYLPPKVRSAFLKDIFELFAKQYQGDMYTEKARPINAFTYDVLRQYIDEYGIDYAVHSYIPFLRRNTVMYEFQDWGRAVRVETRGFSGVTIEQIKEMYYEHMRKTRTLANRVISKRK